jgi:predicted TIM-barrel fold metal-dependent hydrolase
MIDIHSHLFNLKYLPVYGIIKRYSLGIIPDPIAKGVEFILIATTKSDIDISGGATVEESVFKKMYNKDFVLPDQKSLFEIPGGDFVDHFVYNMSPSTVVHTTVTKALAEFELIDGVFGAKPTTELFQTFTGNIASGLPPEIEITEMLLGKFKKMLRWVFSKMKQGGEHVEDNLRWFYFMTKSEHQMIERLQASEAGIKLFVHHMMDVDNYFDSNSSFDFATVQIPKMEKLNKEYETGKPIQLMAFVAFDPKKENGLAIIKDAIDNRGFKGVKFYPPMGYRAADNNNEIIQKRIDELFQYCVDKKVAVFTHCNNAGFEAHRLLHSGYNSNPKYWEKALMKHPDLRLCLAHAGGVEGWFAPVTPDDEISYETINSETVKNKHQRDWNSSYAKLVYKLCVHYENVFCDAAYLDEVYDEITLANYRKRLEILFGKTTEKYAFKNKMMYGSDWHMLFKEGKQDTYFTKYQELFDPNNNPDLAVYGDDFFEGNARKFLRI